MFGNNMKYFDQVSFTTNVMRKKLCVDISRFSVFSYRACIIASEVINIGHTKYQVIRYMSNNIMGIYLIFGTFAKKCRVLLCPQSGN